MEDGWIKLHRKMREWQHYQRPSVRLVFEELLFCANTKPTWFHGIKVDRGETIVSVETICAYTGFARATVIAALKILEETKEIKRTKCWRGIRTKIINFDKYQDNGSSVSSIVSSSKIEPLIKPQSELQIEPLIEPEQELNKDKKEKNNIVERDSAREETWLDEFLNSTTQIQVFCMQNGVSERDFRARAREVMNDWELTGEHHLNETEFRRHLLSTIRIKLQNNGTTNANQRNYADDRQAEREQLARSYAATIARRLAEDNERASGLRGPDEIPF